MLKGEDIPEIQEDITMSNIVTVTISTPEGGTTRQEIPVGMTARQQLEEAGVDLANTTAVVNGQAVTLDSVLNEGDRLVVTRDGKGA